MPSDALPDDRETLKAMLLAARLQNDRLRQIITELQRHRFGRRAETLPEDKMLLGLEDVEQAGRGGPCRADRWFIASRSRGPGSQAPNQPGSATGASAAD